jgi:pectinesterase inhibitor-like protein
MTDVCNKTMEPEYCKDCLSSNPQSVNADVKGLATIMITCALYQSLILRDVLVKFSHDPTINYKEQCGKCAIIYNGIHQILSDALSSWKGRRYDVTFFTVKSARQVHFNCMNLLSKIDIAHELEVLFVQFISYANDADGIIHATINPRLPE